jgi:hypothetical protein
MSLRRVDARFVLPRPPASARVLGSLGDWAEGLRNAGVHVGERAGEAAVPDLAVAAAADAVAAAASGAPMVLVEGRGARRTLGLTYPIVERFLPVPSLAAPELILPLGHTAAGDYAVRNWSLARTLRRRVRNHLGRWLLARDSLPELRPLVTVATHETATPFLVRAAGQLAVPDGCEWFLTLGSADPLTRGVFHLFPPAAAEPSWALKFARVPGYTDPFDRDERGLGIAHAAGGVVRRRAPRLLGRLEVAGLTAAVETAAVGSRLTHLLQGRVQRAEKLRSIDAVAGWTIEAALATAVSPDRLSPERRRLAEEVVPSWRDFDVPSDLVELVGSVPAVLQHNDLGSWNIVVTSEADFTAVDWESARAEGFPLWDLVYFLTDALTHLDGASPVERRDAHNARLFRGELASSEILFRWLRKSVDALAIPDESVGPIVTLCWLHHGLSGGHRRAAVDTHTPGHAAAELSEGERIARLWLSAPGLGLSWEAWRRL